MEVTYHKEGEYYLPDLIVPEAPKVGRYGMLRRRFLRENRNGTYTAMLLTGKWTTKGVHTVEEFDPDPYLDALDKYGLPRSESHSPALVD